jgi:hypothetical protein
MKGLQPPRVMEGFIAGTCFVLVIVAFSYLLGRWLA